MKKYILLLFTVLASFSLSSCLESNLDDLPVFTDCEVASVRYVGHRWKVTIPSGQEEVRKKAFAIREQQKLQDQCTIEFKVGVPVASGTFTPEVRQKVSLKNIEVAVQISQAARMIPLDGAPAMGVAGDWTKPNKYRVVAADGKTSKDWTIIVKGIEFDN